MTLKQSSSIFNPKSASVLYLIGYVSWKLGKIGLGSKSTVVWGRWMSTASSSGCCRATVLESVGSLLDLKLRRPNSSVDDVSKIRSCSCSTLLGFVGVWGLVANAGSSLKLVIVGINKSDDCSSSIPTRVSLDELECCAWCSRNDRPGWFCENKISENDVSKLWSDCCCWLISSSCCCCCCNNK